MRSFRERRPWVIGLVSIVVIALGVLGAFSINKLPALRGVYTVSADLRDAAGLRPGNEVRVAGVKVGTVTDIRLLPGAARISMEIQNDVRIPVETKVEVKLRTLLGQKFIDLRFPQGYLAAASGDGDPSGASSGFLGDGDVIPREQTRVPFEIYQAANEGTALLTGIDKRSLRRMIDVLARTVTGSKEELGRALVALDRAGQVLAPKSADISALLRNSEKVTATLAAEGSDLEGILERGANVLGVLADRRATISSLLAATNDLSRTLGLLIQSARGDIDLSVADLDSILAAAESETRSLNTALSRFGVAQEMFARPLKFGRFVEGHACAIGGADSCVPSGSPADPGFPVKGAQPGSVERRQR